MPDAYDEFERSVWHQILPLRWLYRMRVRQGLWYIKLDGTREQLCREAVRHAPLSYRWFGRSLTTDNVDRQLSIGSASREWLELRNALQPGDKIWPFVINPWTTSMRAGYVVVRARKGIATILTLVS